MNTLDWTCSAFEDLSSETLYNILQLRSEVFVVEQNCVYQDMDNYDQNALHVVGTSQDELVCYARLLAPGSKYPDPSAGRIISSPRLRGMGYGKALVSRTLEYCEAHWPAQRVRISAQQRLEEFYRGFGFVTVSESYIEDGIPHIEMVFESGSRFT